MVAPMLKITKTNNWLYFLISQPIVIEYAAMCLLAKAQKFLTEMVLKSN